MWRDGTPIDLTTLVGAPGWILTSAMAINDVGQIAGAGMHNGQVRAFRPDAASVSSRGVNSLPAMPSLSP